MKLAAKLQIIFSTLATGEVITCNWSTNPDGADSSANCPKCVLPAPKSFPDFVQITVCEVPQSIRVISAGSSLLVSRTSTISGRT